MKSFSEKIRQARLAKGLSQQAFADKIGVTVRSVTAYESKGTRPRKNMLYNIADTLGVSIRYLEDDECENPLEGIEKNDYIIDAYESGGAAAATDTAKLLADCTAMLAGGDVSEEQKEMFLQALIAAHEFCKQRAREKFTPKDKEDT